jgi:hypothetical protein
MLRKIKFKLFIFFIAIYCLIKYFYGYGTSNKNQYKVKLFSSNNSLINGICDAKQLRLSKKCFISLLNESNNDKIKYNCNECLMNKNGTIKIIYYHTAWQIDSTQDDYEFRVLNLNLMSFISTQNLCCTRLILWKLRKFAQNKEDILKLKYREYFDKKYFQFKDFNIKLLCMQSFTFKKYKICNSNRKRSLSSIKTVGLTDFLRFFILDIYGGVYTDGDFMYLKDMKPLWKLNFAYRWSFTQNLNTAVMGIGNKIDFSLILDKLISKSNYLQGTLAAFHPYYRLSPLIKNLNYGSVFNYKPFLILHSYFFDPAWLCNDAIIDRLDSRTICTFNEFTDSELIKNENEFDKNSFFPGAFGYHLHYSNTGSLFNNKSYFLYFENHFKKILNIK